MQKWKITFIQAWIQCNAIKIQKWNVFILVLFGTIFADSSLEFLSDLTVWLSVFEPLKSSLLSPLSPAWINLTRPGLAGLRMKMINLRLDLQRRGEMPASHHYHLNFWLAGGGWCDRCDLMLIKPIIKYRRHITHNTTDNTAAPCIPLRVCCFQWEVDLSTEDWKAPCSPVPPSPPPVQWNVWLGLDWWH